MVSHSPVCLDVIIMYRTWLPWGPWLRCPNILFILITTHYYIFLHYHNNWAQYTCHNYGLASAVQTSKHIYKTLPGQEVVFVLPITSVLKKLPVDLAGEAGTIQFIYSSGCCNCSLCYNNYLASSDPSTRAGDCCLMYFVNFWSLIHHIILLHWPLLLIIMFTNFTLLIQHSYTFLQ